MQTYRKRRPARYRSVCNRCPGPLQRKCQRKAVGVDGVTKSEYSENLDENVADLIKRMKKSRYKLQPVRRTYIPRIGSGKLRPLGIPAYEDRLVQSVMDIG